MLDPKHTFNFSQATIIKPIHCKKSAVIFVRNHISPYLANIIQHEHNIKIEKGIKKNFHEKRQKTPTVKTYVLEVYEEYMEIVI